ncbi:helix-turn-helix domain-containing protein [Paludisphaera rhizosphaerae]|uniref:helix-turn-helix domain-containing protein n=1 Tax=Paludisphaera rhizosphaerae TaxID=2711216 RepID=UPI0013EAD2BC|nr:helix-turn-helix domain-containing protein [Paludisphaera rhizosphaerae]
MKRTTDRRAERADRSLSTAGSRIVAAFDEAIEAVRSEARSPATKLTVRTYAADFALPQYGPADVRRVRDLLEMSQVVFSRFLGVGANTVRAWEQGTRPPSPIARRFMGEIEADPDYWRRRLAPPIRGGV